MSENKLKLNNVLRKLRNRSVEFDIEPYRNWLIKNRTNEIN